MPKIEILQDIQIKKAKPQEKEYFLNDGGGLRVLVKTLLPFQMILKFINVESWSFNSGRHVYLVGTTGFNPD